MLLKCILAHTVLFRFCSNNNYFRRNKFTQIDSTGTTILPNGLFLIPAENLIRITHDPFGLSLSPDHKTSGNILVIITKDDLQGGVDHIILTGWC